MKSVKPVISRKSEGNGLNLVTGDTRFGLGYDILGLILFSLVWTLVTHMVFSRPDYAHFQDFMPLPTLKALAAAVKEPHFWASVAASLRRVLVGISLAALVGFPLGILVGVFPRLRRLSHSSLQFIRMVSPLSWMPVALLVFTRFESAVYFLIFMATVCPIVLNTAAGVMTINPQWIKMALNQGATRFQLIRTIVIPATAPHMTTSLRLALGVAWIILVPAEFLGVSSGLGYLINDARDTMAYDRLMAMVIAIGILGFILDRIFQLFQQAFRWSWHK